MAASAGVVSAPVRLHRFARATRLSPRVARLAASRPLAAFFFAFASDAHRPAEPAHVADDRMTEFAPHAV
ncbi:hypothetical protein, partial [Paraburkholderia sp. SIMBA_030]|uniref:hypothetical protein n=1 Tax=Paraburkholderia sp. SIMBA_030 TaxID=3085773 RepID=UPI003978AFCC